MKIFVVRQPKRGPTSKRITSSEIRKKIKKSNKLKLTPKKLQSQNFGIIQIHLDLNFFHVPELPLAGSLPHARLDMIYS